MVWGGESERSWGGGGAAMLTERKTAVSVVVSAVRCDELLVDSSLTLLLSVCCWFIVERGECTVLM